MFPFRHAARDADPAMYHVREVSDMLSDAPPVDRVRRLDQPIQRPFRAFVTAIVVWFAWVFTVAGLARLLPAEIATASLYVALTWVAFSALVVGLAVDYLRRVGVAGAAEGVLLGLFWFGLFAVLDLGHIVLMHPNLLDGYAARAIPPYLAVPAITTLVLGWLRAR
jgi:hypothetical protein